MRAGKKQNWDQDPEYWPFTLQRSPKPEGLRGSRPSQQRQEELQMPEHRSPADFQVLPPPLGLPGYQVQRPSQPPSSPPSRLHDPLLWNVTSSMSHTPPGISCCPCARFCPRAVPSSCPSPSPWPLQRATPATLRGPNNWCHPSPAPSLSIPATLPIGITHHRPVSLWPPHLAPSTLLRSAWC